MEEISKIVSKYDNTITLTISKTNKDTPIHIVLSHCSIMSCFEDCMIEASRLGVFKGKLCEFECNVCKLRIYVENKQYHVQFIFEEHGITYDFMCEDMTCFIEGSIQQAIYRYTKEQLSILEHIPTYTPYEEWIKCKYNLPLFHVVYPMLPPNNPPVKGEPGYEDLDRYFQGASCMVYQLLYHMGYRQIVEHFDKFYSDRILDFDKCINKFMPINLNNCKGLFRIDNVMDQYRVQFFFTTYMLYIETPWYPDMNKALRHVCNNLKEIIQQAKDTHNTIIKYCEEDKSNCKVTDLSLGNIAGAKECQV